MKKLTELKIVPAREGDEDAVFEFLAGSFFVDEPMNAVLKRTPKKELWKPLAYVRSGYSLVAYATNEDGEESMAGVVLNKVEKREDHRKKVAEGPSEGKILDILKKLDEKADMWSKIPSDQVFYTVILSVSRHHRGLNIGRKLIEESLKMALSSGLTHAVVECSSYYSSKIVERLGYQTLCKIRYEDFKDKDGEVIFKIEKPHEEITKFLKTLIAFELDVEKLDDNSFGDGGRGRSFTFRRYPPGDDRKRDLYQSGKEES